MNGAYWMYYVNPKHSNLLKYFLFTGCTILKFNQNIHLSKIKKAHKIKTTFRLHLYSGNITESNASNWVYARGPSLII